MSTDTLPAVTIADTRFGRLRSVSIDSQVWFVAKDVCDALGIKNSRDALINVASTDKNTAKVSEGRGRPVAVVSESGMNDLVLQSRKPAARAFRHLLTSEVIPSLLKHGVYVAGQGSMTDAELRSAVGERAERLIEGTRAERYARIAADTARFEQVHGRVPNAKERFFLEKP
jgi:prophage antirepressor-like protein